MATSGEYEKLVERILKPYDFGSPLIVKRVFAYLNKFDASSILWFEGVTVMDHIANVAMFSARIAEECNKRKSGSVNTHRV